MKRLIILLLSLVIFFTASCTSSDSGVKRRNDNPVLNIEESSDRDLIDAYLHAIGMLIRDDTALNHGTSFYAVEIGTFRGINDDEVNEIQTLIESMGKDFRNATMEELKKDGEFDEDTLALKRSIHIRVDEILKYSETEFLFTASKFRSGLGAIGMTFEFVKTENGWEFSKTSGFWIS